MLPNCGKMMLEIVRGVTQAETQDNVRDGTDVRKDGIRKSRYPIPSRRLNTSRILWMRYGLVASFAFLAILASVLTHPIPGSAAEPLNETRVPPSPTPVQVTPPPTGQLTQTQSWLLPFAGGILVWAAMVSIALLVLAALLFLYVRRRRRPARVGPLQIPSVPFLKSTDGHLYFRLDKLSKDGLIIGRGRHGVDLIIEETTPNVDTVSNRHARIYYNATYGNVIIEDLHSTNGIFINGRQAPHRNLLKDGWVVGLGSVTLTYHDGESDTGPLD
jgi:hypothetical protein